MKGKYLKDLSRMLPVFTIVVSGVLMALHVFTPPHSDDALTYHLPWVESHAGATSKPLESDFFHFKLVGLAHWFFAKIYTPAFPEILVLFNVFAHFLTVWLLYKIGSKLGLDKPTALLVATFAGFNPMLMREGTVIGTQTAYVLFTVLGLYFHLNVFERANVKIFSLVAAGIGLALSVYVKAMGYVSAAVIFGITFVVSMIAGRKSMVRAFGVAAAFIAVLVPLFWYQFKHYSDPFFPLGSALGLFSASEIPRISQSMNGYYGRTLNILSIIKVYLASGPYLIFMVALAGWVMWRSVRRWSTLAPSEKFLLLLLGFYMALPLAGFKKVRFIDGLLPLAYLAMGVLWAKQRETLTGLSRKFTHGLVAATILFNLCFLGYYSLDTIKLISGQVTREEYLAFATRYYDSFQDANQVLQNANAKVAVVGARHIYYFPPQAARFSPRTHVDEEQLAAWRRAGFTHVLLYAQKPEKLSALENQLGPSLLPKSKYVNYNNRMFRIKDEYFVGLFCL